MAELPDLFIISLPNEGPTPCYPLIMIMDNGKTNTMGRLKYMAVVRYRNPLLYIMASLVFYLFVRWDIIGEKPLNF